MGEIIKTSEDEWALLSKNLFNDLNHSIEYLTKACVYIQRAVEKTKYVDVICPLEFSRTREELDVIAEKRNKLVNFSDGIHYEIMKYVDIPFCLRMNKLLDEAYSINPSDIKIQVSNSDGMEMSLYILLYAPRIDDELREDFKNKILSLDNDTPSTSVQEAIKEAVFWEKTFEKAELCNKIANDIFNIEVKQNWMDMSYLERARLITAYKDAISEVLFDDESVYDIPMKFVDDKERAGSVAGEGISLSSLYIKEPIGEYGVDKL